MKTRIMRFTCNFCRTVVDVDDSSSAIRPDGWLGVLHGRNAVEHMTVVDLCKGCADKFNTFMHESRRTK